MTSRSWTATIPAALALLLPAACAPLLVEPGGDTPREAATLWNEAHRAYHLGDVAASEAEFAALADAHPETEHGREALFFAGLLRLDPGHPEWSAEISAARLERYLDVQEDEPTPHRVPEARAALALASQFLLPPGDRIQALRPQVIEVDVPVPADATPDQLRAEIQRLTQQVAERDATIRRQREELERIRRTLIPDDDG